MITDLLIKVFVVVVFLSENISKVIATDCCDADCMEWKAKFNKKYANDELEIKAIQNFNDNKIFIDRHNVKFVNGLVSYDMALTDKSDMTPKEISDQLNGLKPSLSIEIPIEETDQTCPDQSNETTRKPKKLQATPPPPPISKDWRYSLSIARDQGK